VGEEGSVRVELHDAEEEPSGGATWRYRIITKDGMTWVVEIKREEGKYYWTRVQNMHLREENRAQPHASRDEALEAAMTWIQALGARGRET
jgi:hypothetical protein